MRFLWKPKAPRKAMGHFKKVEVVLHAPAVKAAAHLLHIPNNFFLTLFSYTTIFYNVCDIPRKTAAQ